jgi:hypothetical protein
LLFLGGAEGERSCVNRHAATVVCRLSTVAIFCQPSILRNLICPLATRLNSKTYARRKDANNAEREIRQRS